MGFHGNRILRRMVADMIKACGVTSFVETGTCTGITTEYMASSFPSLPIFSCEIDPQYYGPSSARLRVYKNITVSLESSEKFIARLVSEKTLGDFPMFFLDAHWFDYWPLPDEIAAIATLPKSITLVDDFMVPGQGQFEHDNGGGGTIGVNRTKPDSRPCSMALIGSLLPPDCEVGYPNYDKMAAYGNPKAPHLRGHALIVRGAPDTFASVKTGPHYVWGGVR